MSVSEAEPSDFFFGLFLTVFNPWFGFLAHGFLIPNLKLGFHMLVKNLYCIVNILYNEKKETKRAVKL